MKWFRSTGLLGRLLAIFVLVVGIDLLANALLFERANEFSLQEEDAERMAEHLVVAHRLLDDTAPARRSEIARELSTERFRIGWAGDRPQIVPNLELDGLRQQILTAEPDLASTSLRLHLSALSDGGDITGSLVLSDQSTLSFRTYLNDTWSLNAGRIARILLPALLLVLLAAVLVSAALRPLRKLVEASARVGEDRPEAIPEKGPSEIRQLICAFNAMQNRIHELIVNRTTTIAAIGHDLRTPLSRLQMRLENLPVTEDQRTGLLRDLDEMRALLGSMQAFVDGEDTRGDPVRLDLAAMAETLIDNAQDEGHDARYEGPDHFEITAHVVPLRRALTNLIQNAVHYGGSAVVRLKYDARTATVSLIVEDRGPGIRADRLKDALQPFVRLDDARARTTPGMGLGLAIVDRIASAEGGTLTLVNRDGGGLQATLTLPCLAGNSQQNG
ncbi:ATP-binding protein [Altericroceibacterium endophyticum]|uniref:histidine kinase n=1 Tax=Altericroceibacterium endophyticum TaxID=1808508 RepID=A0A6I4T7I9_9SPHN|nr:ATP-binding protein [Altericroceibacterium endophyticum]MXO66648.1 HAMP domain-containing protein [Altericroceibacterium endophyticum]